LVGVSVALFASACGQATTPAGSVDSTGTDVARVSLDTSDAPALADVVAAADVMGLDLIREGGDETTVTSPASLQVALSMAAEGAEGQTLKELETLLGASGRERSDAFNVLTATLADLDGDPAIVMDDELPETPMVHRANGLVLDDDFTANPNFVDVLAQSYGAPATTTDLGSTEGKKVLDAWANENTGGLIPESAIVTSPSLALVLQDAIVMAAPWADPFDAALTEPADFTLPSGASVSVDMMDTYKERPTLYAKERGWETIRLPYVGGRLYADVMLPPEGTNPDEMTSELLGELSKTLAAAEPQPVVITMPIVDAKSKLDLLDYLSNHAPSSLGGGFGPMGSDSLAISQAWQQGVLKVNEEGTVAAALTEIGFDESASTGVYFTVDRPYLVRIAEAKTGWPLFFSHIADPRADD